jgi:enterochelin esterase-like enzyme/outer membrane protein assembly factor BamB
MSIVLDRHRVGFLIPLLAASLSWSSAPEAEWPALRGPNADGSAPAGATFHGQDEATLAVAWRGALGPGYSGVAVAQGTAVTLFSDGREDVVAAFDAKTGRALWRRGVAPTYQGHDGSFDGPIATPAIAGGRAFALAPHGQLAAFDLASGRPLWSTHLAKDHGGREPYYGFAGSPLVAADTLVVPLGAGQGRAIAGFDPATGRLRWALGDDTVSYQSPVVIRVAGREQVLAVGDKKLFGIDAAAGRLLWEHAHGGATVIGIESVVPVPAGDGRVFLEHQADASTMLRIALRADGGYALETLWTAPVLRSTYSLPVYHEGHLYGINGRTVLTCVDAATGALRWRSREPGDGFLALVGSDLVVLTKERTLHVGPASPQGWKERARLELFGDLVWTPPSFAGGAVFARSQGELARVEWRLATATAPAAMLEPADEGTARAGDSRFARFQAELAGASDKAAVVDRFLASLPSVPLVEWPDRVVFLYRGPGEDMAIAGDLIGERREDPMQRVPGTDLFWYEARLDPDARVSYQFVRDHDERLPDPRNPRRAPGSRFAPSGPQRVELSSLEMPAWRPPDHLRAPAPERCGSLESHELTSAARPGAKTGLHVYLPAAYDAGRDRLPAAYVLGGDEARDLGEVPRALDHVVGRSVAPVVVVFVGRIEWGTQRPAEDQEADAGAELLAREVVAFVDARYRTAAEPARRAVVGAGFDGWDAAYAAFRHPEVFGALGTQSLFMLKETESLLKQRVGDAKQQPLRLYLDWGRYDLRATREAWDTGAMNRRFAAFLRERGYRPAGGEAPDGFGWASWRNRVDRLFAALFPAQPQPPSAPAPGAN